MATVKTDKIVREGSHWSFDQMDTLKSSKILNSESWLIFVKGANIEKLRFKVIFAKTMLCGDPENGAWHMVTTNFDGECHGVVKFGIGVKFEAVLE